MQVLEFIDQQVQIVLECSTMLPVLRLGIIGSKFDGYDIGQKIQRFLKTCSFHIRQISFLAQCMAVTPKLPTS